MLVKGLLCRLASLEWPQLLSVLFFILLPRKLRRKETGFMAPVRPKKGLWQESRYDHVCAIALVGSKESVTLSQRMEGMVVLSAGAGILRGARRVLR